MISLKSLVKYMREAKIAKPRVGRETPMDANVQIPGFGVMTRKQMRGSIQRYIAEVAKCCPDVNLISPPTIAQVTFFSNKLPEPTPFIPAAPVSVVNLTQFHSELTSS